MRCDQALHQPSRLDVFGGRSSAGIERADAFHQRLLEGSTDGHCFTHGFHLRAESLFRARKLLKLPLWDLHDDVINRGLEARGSLARDVVGNFIERVSHREPSCNFGNGEACGLRG